MSEAPGDPLDFAGKIALITGGSRGIGKGIAERFLRAGAEVAVCSRRPPAAAPSAGGREAYCLEADVRDSEQARACVRAVVERFGALDVLVNNAGGSPRADSATASPRFAESIVRLNLTAPLHCAQAANAEMQGQPAGGCIINISSVSAIRPSPGTAVYGAAKAGLVNLCASLAVEWAPKVRVNAVIAGLIVTEQAHVHYGDEEGIARVGRSIPLGRMGTPDDIADACLFLASPMARYISGSALTVHGGGEAPLFLQAQKTAGASGAQPP